MDPKNPLLLFSIIAIQFVLSLAHPLNEPKNPLVKIGDGEIIGKFENSVSRKQHSAFLGIPFAKPPVRSLLYLMNSVYLYTFHCIAWTSKISTSNKKPTLGWYFECYLGTQMVSSNWPLWYGWWWRLSLPFRIHFKYGVFCSNQTRFTSHGIFSWRSLSVFQ